MSTCMLLPIEGVLTQGMDLKTAAPLKLVKPFYDSFQAQFRMVALTRADQELARWWLRRERLANWSSVLSWNQAMHWEDWKVDTVREFLANAWEVSFYVDSDAPVVERVLDLGVPIMLMRFPSHHLGWQQQPVTIRPWPDVVDTLETRP